MIKKLQSFDEKFPTHAKKADELHKEYARSESGMTKADKQAFNEKVEALTRDALDNDLCYRLENGRMVALDAKTKQMIQREMDMLISHNLIGFHEPKGVCLGCGKAYKSGDIRLAETDGSSNSFCIDCCTKANKVGYRYGTELQLCQ